jgi:hypothetical protein
MPVNPRTAAGTLSLTLDGTPVGFVKSALGGEPVAEVIEQTAADSGFSKKHIGPPTYEPIQLRVGLGLAKELYDWIADSWNMTHDRKDGAIVTADANLGAKSQRQFFDALITETTFPALDGASKDAAFLTLKFAPEHTRVTKASGKVTAPTQNLQKQFVASNFRLELAGLDTTKVSRIESFTVRQNLSTFREGTARDTSLVPGRIEFPNLSVTLAEASAQTWLDWFEDFVVRGNNGDGKEKEGRIVFLAADRKTEIASVSLHNVGIFALRQVPQAGEQVARLRAELYCERMQFQFGAKPAVRPRVRSVVSG